MTIRLGGQHGLRIDGRAVEQDGIRAGQAVLVAKLDRVAAEPAQRAQQPFMRRDSRRDRLVVEGESDCGHKSYSQLVNTG